MIIWSTCGGNLIFPISFKALITPSGSSSRNSAFVIPLGAIVVFEKEKEGDEKESQKRKKQK